jgi:hypothetical protein
MNINDLAETRIIPTASPIPQYLLGSRGEINPYYANYYAKKRFVAGFHFFENFLLFSNYFIT